MDRSGNLYIADNLNNRVRRVDAKSGIITTVAGNGFGLGSPAFSGVTSAPTKVAIGAPGSIAVSSGGDVYWTVLSSVLKLDSSGVLSVAAGNGGCAYAGDGGPATLASLCKPFGISFDDAGNVFISESDCGCVRRVAIGTGLIQTVAGTGTPGVSPDSIPALQAALSPAALGFARNTLYFVDRAQGDRLGRIRAITPATPPAMPQPPKITQIVDGVAFRSNFSPGAIISVMGNYLSLPSPATGEIGPNGRITTTLNGSQVIFNGTAGPLLYASAGQINAVIPYSTPVGKVAVQVKSEAGVGSFEDITLTQTSLSFFDTLIFNPNGTVNGFNNPAPKGSTLLLYGTGMGQTNPAGVDGAVLQGPDFPRAVTRFAATVQNRNFQSDADILYLGPMPGFVSGAVQANIRIPDAVPAGESILKLSPVPAPATLPPPASLLLYLQSDTPVLLGIKSYEGILQDAYGGATLTVNGTKLEGVIAMSFRILNGKPTDGFESTYVFCAPTACSFHCDFFGRAGDYELYAVNAARQTSNRLTFSVLPLGPPTVTAIDPLFAPLAARKGFQFLSVKGSNFHPPCPRTSSMTAVN